MNPTESHSIQTRFSATPAARHWARVGFKKRAGVAVPLFSLYSRKSQGVGDFTDLKILVDWCVKTGLSIIQLLPLNDVGFNFRPYDAVSMFALEPMFISLNALSGVEPEAFKREIRALQVAYPTGGLKVQYGIKAAKLELLRKIFSSRDWETSVDFLKFQADNRFWLENYALFKVIKQDQQDAGWESWEAGLRDRETGCLEALRGRQAQEIRFQKWLQWQAAEQLSESRTYANHRGVLILGDIPLLVSRDSADVWAHQNYFKLDWVSGAPPDAYAAAGQRWGMPPYHWENIAASGYDYLKEKLRYAGRFYDLFRIDHFVGVFRLWTIPVNDPPEHGGMHGRFDPPEEHLWEGHGLRLVQTMLEASDMLPCAEDLGVIPPCSYKTIDEQGLLGMDIQRWNRDWDTTMAFKTPENYRLNSIAVISTHDMSSFKGWWQFEAGTVDEDFFRQLCRNFGYDFEWLCAQWFEAHRPHPNRLHWKPQLDALDKVMPILGRRWEEVRAFSDLYRSSFFEKIQFWEYLGLKPTKTLAYSKKLMRAALVAANRSRSMFSIQLLQDWLGLSEAFDKIDFSAYRINAPGTVNDRNWTLTMPFTLEELLTFPENEELLELNRETGRAVEA